MNIHLHHHIFRRRFVYIHTFFHRKIMRGCQLRTCLYDIRQTSYERRLHHSRVAPSVPIWATFAFTIGKICPQLIRAATPVLSRAAIVYRHILLGENLHSLIRTRAHEKIRLDFSPRKAIIRTVYCWEKCKKCKVRMHTRFFALIYCFIWIKYNLQNMVIGNCWQSS